MPLDDSRTWKLSVDILLLLARVVVTVLRQLRASRADSLGNSKSLRLAMEPFDLKFVKFDVEVLDEVFKDISTLTHKFGGLLVCQDLVYILIWPLKVREQENKDLLWVS